MLTAIIDIDNTLWDFASVLHEKVRKINPDIPEPALWDSYHFWRNYVSEKQASQAIEEIHVNQEKYSPFAEASDFLAFLAFEKGCHIIIASHRDPKHSETTLRWLRKNKLFHHEIYLSFDKSVLFEKGRIVIDDNPKLLQKAVEKGCIATGLEYGWNRHVDAKLFKSLTDIKSFIKNNRRNKLCPPKIMQKISP